MQLVRTTGTHAGILVRTGCICADRGELNMRSTLALVTLLVASLSLFAEPSDRPQLVRATGTPSPSAEQSLPLRRVILYSNGVAYFERRGKVTGHAEINLSFKESQMDDVLKSMIVLDLGQGHIGAINYNSSAPLSARLTEIPFSIAPQVENSNEGGLPGVLRQLQGTRVTVAAGNRTAAGAILTVEDRTFQIDGNKPAQVNHWLVLASETGELASFNLADIRSVRVLDGSARQSINNFCGGHGFRSTTSRQERGGDLGGKRGQRDGHQLHHCLADLENHLPPGARRFGQAVLPGLGSDRQRQ